MKNDLKRFTHLFSRRYGILDEFDTLMDYRFTAPCLFVLGRGGRIDVVRPRCL